MSIVFGTDGWRGIIARDFTYDNLALVATATAIYIKRLRKKQLESLPHMELLSISHKIFLPLLKYLFIQNKKVLFSVL
jgi:phosphomannomutase